MTLLLVPDRILKAEKEMVLFVDDGAAVVGSLLDPLMKMPDLTF
jgi:hypothetical protein